MQTRTTDVDAMSPAPALITSRAAVATVFLCFGLAIGLLGGSVPEIARLAGTSAEIVGSAFFGASIAGILGLTLAGRIGGGVSLKKRLLILLLLAAVSLAVLFHTASAAALIASLFIFTFFLASIDLVMNSEGVAVERDLDRPVLSGFHGLASLGVGLGAISGSYLSVTAGLSATAVVSLLVHALAILAVVLGTPDRGATQPVDAGSSWFWPPAALVALSLVLGVSMAGEMAATMFSAQTLVDQAPALAAYAGAGATAFALFQATVRLGGDRLRALLGDERLIRVSLAAAFLGFAVIATSSSFAVSAFGFAAVGVGTACIVPCGFAAAARMSAKPAAAVISMLSLITGLVRIPAPLAYGWLAGEIGFAPAYLLYALLAAAALFLAFFAVGRARLRSSE
ncbi:hypothetical protein ACG873_14270 [Mesorhizobium sp. AaZ16]|uniref:hypothetical protein n=1 Tax=Mesorhizobium sp. AaZ16 TaxID=3402289 RepID=UPI00374E5244